VGQRLKEEAEEAEDGVGGSEEEMIFGEQSRYKLLSLEEIFLFREVYVGCRLYEEDQVVVFWFGKKVKKKADVFVQATVTKCLL
jgi:hypothetical protein